MFLPHIEASKRLPAWPLGAFSFSVLGICFGNAIRATISLLSKHSAIFCSCGKTVALKTEQARGEAL
jgi:hypothetical protein